MAKTIFITGASRGFGRIWAEAFLNRGDKVAGTARDIKALADLEAKFGKAFLPIQLDVTRKDDCFAAVSKAHNHFGSLDVIINNAGFSLLGAVEETTEQQARDIMETNFFGTLWVTQAALPILRAQGHGHIIQVSSLLGQVAMPILSLYNASKFALEGFSESLAAEVKDFGINVTLVEPNGYSTGIEKVAVYTQGMKEYEPVKTALFASFPADAYGSPTATINAVLMLVDSKTPPLRLFLGKYALPSTKDAYARRLEEWEKWSDVSVAAHG